MSKHTVVFLLGALMGLILSPAVSVADNRPATDQLLFSCLNGEETRPQYSDGGGIGMYVTDAGASCATVSGGRCWKVTCDVAANICPVALDGANATFKNLTGDDGGLRVSTLAQDGGCNGTIHDANYGAPLPAATDRLIVTNPGTTSICAHPQAGATLNCAVFQMR